MDYIAIVLNGVRKYEKKGDRKHMIYDDMVSHLLAKQKTLHPDSRDAAIIDWIILGRYTGFRAIEWCQERVASYRKIDHPTWVGPDSYAFIAEDFTFYDKGQCPIYDLSAATIDDVHFVKIRWRKQKNDSNGETIPYEKDEEFLALCPVYAAFRIRQRAQRLNVPAEHPIGVYKPSRLHSTAKTAGLSYHFIKGEYVDNLLRDTAKIVFKLNADDKTLQRWTAHSIRVTACKLLHRENMSDSYIQ